MRSPVYVRPTERVLVRPDVPELRAESGGVRLALSTRAAPVRVTSGSSFATG